MTGAPQQSTPPRDAKGQWIKKSRRDREAQQETRNPAAATPALIFAFRKRFVCPDPSATRQFLTLAEAHNLKVTFPGMVVELCGPGPRRAGGRS